MRDGGVDGGDECNECEDEGGNGGQSTAERRLLEEDDQPDGTKDLNGDEDGEDGGAGVSIDGDFEVGILVGLYLFFVIIALGRVAIQVIAISLSLVLLFVLSFHFVFILIVILTYPAKLVLQYVGVVSAVSECGFHVCTDHSIVSEGDVGEVADDVETIWLFCFAVVHTVELEFVGASLIILCGDGLRSDG